MYRVLNSDRRSRRRAHLLLDHCGTSSKFSQDQAFFKKMGQSRPLCVYFCSFLVTISIQIEISVDGVLGIRTRGRRMVGADETTELWRPPKKCNSYQAIQMMLNFDKVFSPIQLSSLFIFKYLY